MSDDYHVRRTEWSGFLVFSLSSIPTAPWAFAVQCDQTPDAKQSFHDAGVKRAAPSV
ncbi:hypothetical protein [Pararhodobacter sp. SW119]|uniref:hypothetical protein n=1 Tax=Pararhodobacter sp. SW119 TaxID=2780075 RepID=UPI001ADFCA6F|nr:hypothetical protein [Pararhodobacter sp. SW119]